MLSSHTHKLIHTHTEKHTRVKKPSVWRSKNTSLMWCEETKILHGLNPIMAFHQKRALDCLSMLTDLKWDKRKQTGVSQLSTEAISCLCQSQARPHQRAARRRIRGWLTLWGGPTRGGWGNHCYRFRLSYGTNNLIKLSIKYFTYYCKYVYNLVGQLLVSTHQEVLLETQL